MSARIGYIILRFVIAFAVVSNLFLPTAGASPSHDRFALAAAEFERHSELSEASTSDGHVHDHGNVDERAPGHAHGHNAGDHTHDAPALLALNVPVLPKLERRWPSAPATLLVSGLEGGLYRPPRWTDAA